MVILMSEENKNIGRKLTLVVSIADESGMDIWDAIKNGQPFHGLKITSISYGDLIKQIEMEAESSYSSLIQEIEKLMSRF